MSLVSTLHRDLGRIALISVLLLIGAIAPFSISGARAATVNLTVPGNLIGSVIISSTGTVYTPNAAGQIAVPIGGEVEGFLRTGFALAPSAGAGTALFNTAGSILVNTTVTGNGADTTEDTLVTYALPASTLNIVGKCVKVTGYVHFATNADNKTTKLYFGSEAIATPTAATSNKNGQLELIACKTGASTQIVVGKGIVDTTSVTPYVATGAETDTSAITIKLTGQAGTATASDIASELVEVDAIN